jgi:glycosyltransferase involved in cell wall biosynthesis
MRLPWPDCIGAVVETTFGQDLVIVSGEFGRYPSSIEHMVRKLAHRHRILWIEVTGMRRPTVSMYDARRAAGKIMRLVRGAQRTESVRSGLPDNMVIASPFTIPFPESSWVQRFNDETLFRSIADETRTRRFNDFGLITTLPMAAGSFARRDALRRTGAAWTMYYCPDEWALWPGMNTSLVRDWEVRLLSAVDGVAVASEHLKKSKARDGRCATIIKHGVDVGHFEQAFRHETKQKFVFFGLFDDRMDQDLLVAVAKRFAEHTIEVIGPVQTQLQPDLLLKNVTFSGPVAYERLPDAVADAGILILPYLRNELTDNINPLKARECLATGKPVVATALPELRLLDHVFLAEDHAQFIGHLERLTGQADLYDSVAAINAMRPHSWDARASDLMAFAQGLTRQSH